MKVGMVVDHTTIIHLRQTISNVGKLAILPTVAIIHLPNTRKKTDWDCFFKLVWPHDGRGISGMLYCILAPVLTLDRLSV